MTRWAVVELMGHRRLAGLLTEITQFGVTMGRVEVPENDQRPGFVQDFSGASVYAITDVSEDFARRAGLHLPHPEGLTYRRQIPIHGELSTGDEPEETPPPAVPRVRLVDGELRSEGCVVTWLCAGDDEDYERDDLHDHDPPGTG